MAHLQYNMPGDPRLVDQLVYELKSKGIFDQFRKECISDVDTRPAYQNLRQRVESSVSTFLSRQVWKPDLNKNQLREKLRKHILDGNYLEQGVERIVDQVVNPKVASVFIPQVEDLVYNYLGIPRKKTTEPETSNGTADLLPTDLEAVSPGSVHSNDGKESMDIDVTESMDIDDEDKPKEDIKEDSIIDVDKEKEESRISGISELTIHDSDISIDKSTTTIPLPKEEIKLENIPAPEYSPPKINNKKIDLEKIDLPKEPNLSTDIPLPDEMPKVEGDAYFKPVNSEDDESSSDSSVRRNVSPLTPIRNFNNENSCDAQQAFENDSDCKDETKKEPSSFRFTIEAKSDNSPEEVKIEKKEEPIFNAQSNLNFNTPLYDDSSNSNNLQIDYESDANSKIQDTKEVKTETDQNSRDSQKKEKKDDKKSHKSSHKSRDSHRHSSSKDKRSDSKQSTSRDSSRHDKKKDDKSKSSKDRPSDKGDRKDRDSRDSSKHRSSSHKSSSKDSKHRSSTSGRHSSKDEKKPSTSSEKDKDKISSKDKPKDSKSSRDKDKKSVKKNDKESKEKKEKKDVDDHYSLSGRGNHNRRSTDRDSNDGSSSSKGSHNPSSAKTSSSKKDGKNSSKSDNTSTSGDSNSPCDGVEVVQARMVSQNKRVVRVDNRLETPSAYPPRLPFVPDVTLKKPRFAANLAEAKQMMKMRKFLEEEQKRMNQEAALLLEFQANVRPSLSQVYSSIPGPELEFACVSTSAQPVQSQVVILEDSITPIENIPEIVHEETKHDIKHDEIAETLIALHGECNTVSQETEETSVSNDEQNKDSITEMLTDSKVEVKENKDSITEMLTDSKVKVKENKDSITEMLADSKVEVSENNKDSITEMLTDSKVEVKANKDSITEMLSDSKVEVKENKDSITEMLTDSKVEVKENKDSITEMLTDSKVEVKENKVFITEMLTNSKVEVKENDIKKDLIELEDILEVNNDAVNIEENSEKLQIFVEENCETENDKEVTNNNIDEATDNTDVEMVDMKENIISDNSILAKALSVEIICKKMLHYFGEHEKFNAEIEKNNFSKFLKEFNDKLGKSKLFLVNCDAYVENLVKEASKEFGEYDIVNYLKNGHLKLPNAVKNIVTDINIATELVLPRNNDIYESPKSPTPQIFSPTKSECSFELSSDYDAKLEEMVNKTSREEIMEIILGSVIDVDDSTGVMPQINYCNESNIEDCGLKRKMVEVETNVNNNRQVLTPNKLRKLSGSDQISSTTEETEATPINRDQNNTRSKYLGKAKRVGLPRPKKTALPLPNSPSSDKSVENYEQNETPNGKIKTPRNKVQRYDTSDLYKPKLHYLSRRNHIT